MSLLSTWVNFVVREGASDGTPAIWKTMRHQEWENLLLMQDQPISVPRILATRPGGEDGVVQVCMEDVGQTHLETEMTRFPQALEVLKQIRQLPFLENEQSITIESLQKEVRDTVDAEQTSRQLGCSDEQRQLLIAAQSLYDGGIEGQQDWLVPAHGDLHPRNILMKGDELVVIDWEWAGQHSVFRDIYALADMCYPDADAFPLDDVRGQIRNQALRQAEVELGLSTRTLDAGYEVFLFFERLLECRNIAGDLATARRPSLGLVHQAMFVLGDLEKRWRRLSS